MQVTRRRCALWKRRGRKRRMGRGGNYRVASHGHEPEVPLTRGDSLLDACTLDFPEAG